MSKSNFNRFLVLMMGLLTMCVTQVWADNFSTTYSYGLSGWSLTNYTDQSSYYQVPSGNDPSVATISGIFSGKTITSNVVVTINCATYGSGTNPSASTFSLYKETACTNAITAAQGGTLPTSSTYENVTYTITQANAASLGDDLTIKITKPGKTIRLKSITVGFTYTTSSAPAVHRTVTWYVNSEVYTTGDPTVDVEDGSKVTALPTEPTVPDGCSDKVFVGWTTGKIETGTDTAPAVLFKDAANAPIVTGGDAKYYAVFADEN